MKTPFVSRSRSIKTSSGDLARYVPAFDGLFLYSEEAKRDPLVFPAETAHRWFSLNTNIGNLCFGLELHQAAALSITPRFLNSAPDLPSAQRRFRGMQWSWISWLDQKLDMVFDSCETLDETCSLAFCYAITSYNKLDSRRVDDTARSYHHLIRENYDRLKPLIDSKKNSDWWLSLFRDAAALGREALNPQKDGMELTSCSRFEFFLSAAEKGLQRGIPPLKLRDLWIEQGAKEGYTVEPSYEISSRKEAFASMIVPPTAADVVGSLLDMIDKDEPTNILYDDFARFVGRRCAEAAVLDSKPLAFSSPGVLALFPEDGHWSCRPRITGNNPQQMWGCWARWMAEILLRDSLLANKDECPLNSIHSIYPIYRDENPFCFPISDERCLFRKTKSSLFTDTLSPRFEF